MLLAVVVALFSARYRWLFLTEWKLQFAVGAVLFLFCVGCSGRATVGLDENGRLVATVDNTAPITGTSTVIAGPSGQTPPPRVAPPTQSSSQKIIRWPRTVAGERMAACWYELEYAVLYGKWADANLLAIRFSRLCGRITDEGVTTDEADERRAADEVDRRANAALAEMDGRR